MRASIEDLWLNDTATTAVKRALNGARDPKRAKVPESMRKKNYGIGARWQVSWMVDRKRQRKSFRDRRKAEEFAAMLEDDIRSGRYVDPADMARTVGQAGEEAFPLLVPVIKAATWNRYRRDWDNHVAPYWARLPLSALTPAALGAWIAALSDGSAASCHGIALSASSVKGIHRALSVAVEYAVENGWLPSDPLRRVTWPKTGRDVEPRVYLTIAQVEALARAAGEHGLEIRFLSYTGLRIGEALALRVADIDLRHRRVNVARTKTVSRTGHREVVGPPKNGRARKVPIVEPLVEPLASLCRGRDGGEPLFMAPRGGSWSVSNWRSRVWRPALREAGLDRIDGLVVHSLRHTYASIAVAGGADVKTLQKAMGHSSASITLDVYADLWPDSLDNVADAIGRAVSGKSLGNSWAMDARNTEGY